MRTNAHYLWDIIEAADAIDRFLAGKTFAQFEQDDLMRSAVHSKLIIIGEAVSHLPALLTDKYPAIPWHEIRGLRNAVVHGYFKVDWEIIWGTATKDTRELRDVATEILRQEYPQFQPENY